MRPPGAIQAVGIASPASRSIPDVVPHGDDRVVGRERVVVVAEERNGRRAVRRSSTGHPMGSRAMPGPGWGWP